MVKAFRIRPATIFNYPHKRPKDLVVRIIQQFIFNIRLVGGAALAVYAAIIADKNLLFFAAVPILFLTGQFIHAVLRQKMADKLLKYGHRASGIEHRAMKAARAVDILFFWIWSLLMLFFIISSAFGRTIRWRGIRYKLLGPTETIVVNSQS
jgi:hypothetical protein